MTNAVAVEEPQTDAFDLDDEFGFEPEKLSEFITMTFRT